MISVVIMVLNFTDVDKALNEETAGGWHLWGIYLWRELFQ